MPIGSNACNCAESASVQGCCVIHVFDARHAERMRRCQPDPARDIRHTRPQPCARSSWVGHVLPYPRIHIYRLVPAKEKMNPLRMTPHVPNRLAFRVRRTRVGIDVIDNRFARARINYSALAVAAIERLQQRVKSGKSLRVHVRSRIKLLRKKNRLVLQRAR